jgi:hypothetical protein
MQNLQPQTYIMIFIFSGLALVGLFTIGLAVYIVVQQFHNFGKPSVDQRRWTRDWESIERELDK